MKQLNRVSVSVFIIAALSLAPGTHAIGITIGLESTAGSEVNPGSGYVSDETDASETLFPEATSITNSGSTASADWFFENDPTGAVFSADSVIATIAGGNSAARNFADLAFVLDAGVDYSVSGGISWPGKIGQKITATVTLLRVGETEPILKVDEQLTYFGLPINIPDFSLVAEGSTSGFLEAGSYTIAFSLGIDGASIPGGSTATANFSVILGDPGGSSEPLIGGTPVDGQAGWFFSDWFGFYNTDGAPWIFHDAHGFLYRFPESSNDNMFVYDNAMDAWWWTNNAVYPFIYVFDPPADISDPAIDIDSNWVWYLEGSMTPRWFYVLTGPNEGSWLRFNP